MKYSFSFSTADSSRYAVQIESLHEDFLSPEIQKEITESHIEIADITLDRLSGTEATDVRILQQIASSVADVFFESDNLVLYYYCDDMNAIPTVGDTHQNVRPQEYRSKLFSLLFERYVQSHHISNINNLLIRFGEGQYECFVHIIYRKEHSAIIEKIKNDLMSGYSK